MQIGDDNVGKHKVIFLLKLIYLFLTNIYFSFDLVSTLFEDCIGNNILRRIIEKIGDAEVLKRITDHICGRYDVLMEIRKNEIHKIGYCKVVVDLANKRLFMAIEKRKVKKSFI